MIKRIFLILIICTGIMPISAIEKVCLVLPDYFQGTKDQKQLVASLSQRAVLFINQKFPGYISASYEQNKAAVDYIVDLMPTFAGASSSLTAMMKKTTPSTVQPVPTSLQGEISLDIAENLADGIFLQWAAFHDFLENEMTDPPVLVDEISTDVLKKSLISEIMGAADLMPQGIALKQNGNFIVGFSFLDAELDRFFKITGQPGKIISDAKNNSYAYGIGVTPGNTVYFKPSTGRDILRVVEGLPRAQKWKAGIDLYGPFTVMPDGSVVLIDQNGKKSLKILDKERTELGLFSSAYSMPSAVTTGPEGNLWVYDIVERRIKILTTRGEFIKGITPIISPYDTMVPSSFSVYKDGSFVISSFGELLCFRSNGVLLWRMKAIQGEIEDKLPTMFYFTVDPVHGLIYLTDPMGKRIIKLLDVAYCRQHNIKNPEEERLVGLNRRIWADDSDTGPIIEKAYLYEEKSAFEMALYQWDSVFSIDPFNGEAAEHIDAIEVKILLENARQMKAEALDIMNRVGPASAERIYKLTLQLYEEILNIDPGNEDVLKELEDLKQRYTNRDAVAGKASKPIKITRVELDNIYPSLMHYYRKNPVGQVTVQNTLDEKITSVRANIFLKRYMDSETESDPVAEIGPGETMSINLYALLNENIFSLEEDLPKLAEITVKYLVDGSEYSVTRNTGLTIYRRTSLAWDDSGKLASFIMPNDALVSAFSHKVVDEGEAAKKYRLSKKFFRAIRICDALGLYGIKYIEDPDSPFSKVLGKEEMVDTVRFPRTTLLIRSGDCDDSTALLGSLLESAGIRTAVMTSPGHVFLAFDTGEPEQNLWQFRTSRFEAIANSGTVWIPVETTLLKAGFKAAWAKSSEIVRKNKEHIEFLPVYKLRSQYPPLPLPESQFSVVEPDQESINLVYNDSVGGVVDNIYTGSLDELESKLKTASGNKKARMMNQIGVLHARFDQYLRAEKMFDECISEFPAYTAAYANRANLLIEQSNFVDAIDTIEDGLKLKPDSTTLNLLMAKCYYSTGNKTKVSQYYTLVEKKSPTMASNYAYLLDSNTWRASAADDQPPSIWLEDEE